MHETWMIFQFANWRCFELIWEQNPLVTAKWTDIGRYFAPERDTIVFDSLDNNEDHLCSPELKLMIIGLSELSFYESVMSIAMSPSVKMMEEFASNRWNGFGCFAIEEKIILRIEPDLFRSVNLLDQLILRAVLRKLDHALFIYELLSLNSYLYLARH
jgi:hypothetical protein